VKTVRLMMIPGERWIVEGKGPLRWVPIWDSSFDNEIAAIDEIERIEKAQNVKFDVRPSPSFFRIVTRPDGSTGFEKWVPFLEWRHPCNTSGWMRHGPLNGDFETPDAARRAFYEYAVARADVVLIEHAAPSVPAALVDETPETVAAMMDRAFRIVPVFVIERYHAAPVHKWDPWSRAPGSVPVTFATEADAEAAVLEFGKTTYQTVTLIRGDGAEIVTASPGSTFPRQVVDIPAVKPPAPAPFAEHVQNYQPAGKPINPVQLDEAVAPKDVTYWIKPTIGLKAWVVWRWYADRMTWLPVQRRTPFNSYWQAVDWIADEARILNRVADLVVPSDADLARWSTNGMSVETPAAPVTITDVFDAVAEDVGETIGVTAPAPEIGTKIAVPLSDDLWAIDEWTPGGWARIDDDLSWDEVHTKLRPNRATLLGINIGDCKIEPRAGAETFDVFQWTGQTWKMIAGDVTLRTAEGVVTARANDPENRKAAYVPIAPTDKLKQYRKLVREVRTKLETIDEIAEEECLSTRTLPDDIRKMQQLAREALDLLNATQ
jgi:hypothetical protein